MDKSGVALSSMPLRGATESNVDLIGTTERGATGFNAMESCLESALALSVISDIAAASRGATENITALAVLAA